MANMFGVNDNTGCDALERNLADTGRSSDERFHDAQGQGPFCEHVTMSPQRFCELQV